MELKNKGGFSVNFYIDITLLPDPGMSLNFLWEKVYRQLHLSFVKIQDENGVVPIGISLPGYKNSRGKTQLGNKVRLFSDDKDVLSSFDVKSRLKDFEDYLHFTAVREVPERVNSYACFRRIQAKSSNERLARRKAKREEIGLDEALSTFKSRKEQKISMPYIHVKSSSSQQRFRLFIEKIESETKVNNGFNSYGLSSESTVPEF